ncbi:MAG: MBL fold metallo-hydrolase [Gammaproteobacteria bacterium]
MNTQHWMMYLFLAFLLALVTARAHAVQTPYGESDVPFTLHRVPGTQVYYVLGQSGVPGADNQGHTSNAGFVVTARGVVVYDALGTPALGYRLLQAIRSVTDRPVSIVVAGHYHADHVYGLQAFREHTQAVIWAQRRCFDYLDGPVGRARLAQRREALFPWVDEKTYLVRPDKTFAQRHEFDMGDTHLELVYVGPAHAPDDTMMIVREAGVVFSGDLIYGGRLPFLGGDEVNTRNWLAGLKHLGAIKPAPRFIIPGHGQPADDAAAAIGFTRGYIQYLRTQMGKAAQDLTGFAEAYARTDWSRYRDVPTFKAANRKNAYHVYLEMEAESF